MNASAVHSLWTTAAEPVTKIDTPKIEYGQLSPILIIIAAAVLGILIEAVVPRKARYHTQLFTAVVALTAAFAASSPSRRAATAPPRRASSRWAPSPSTDPPCSSRAPSC